MPRPRKDASSSLSSLTPGQARYILEKLMNDRRISSGDVTRYIGDMHREIDDLEQRLQSLRTHAAGARRGPGRPPGSGARAGAASPAPARKRGRRNPALSPEQRASRQLQGRYLGLIRQIPATRRAQYARIAKEKGREAAIKEMTNTLNK